MTICPIKKFFNIKSFMGFKSVKCKKDDVSPTKLPVNEEFRCLPNEWCKKDGSKYHIESDKEIFDISSQLDAIYNKMQEEISSIDYVRNEKYLEYRREIDTSKQLAKIYDIFESQEASFGSLVDDVSLFNKQSFDELINGQFDESGSKMAHDVELNGKSPHVDKML
ncbi:hypothetical protein phytr_3000 [Candidatus Phycorickettsia trachydisci]|uniref:Uncharacterized protein n=1 Tax=Candidatus Phycorickettsia trachydisci TaxID=2115978 RepID=A0A2P1P7L6_9RICK|nr:hypothetical protein [Candidatus Phycorickettsia trachydisci]AVP87256.1 hypothetical protein phytr_3000 [Candidatus Phycorickettsia trachydisci]